jgi:phosphoribosylformylglycinamidine (FGAM) synthase-like amidotransferase family enzyme
VFDNIEWYSESNLPGVDVVNLATFSDSFNSKTVELDNSSSDLYFPYKVIKEKLTKLPVPRTEAEYRFRDTYLKVLLSTNSTSKLLLHYVKTLFRISRR